MNKHFDNTLIKILEKKVLREKWRKKFRVSGKITDKRLTRKGSFMFTINTYKKEYDVVVSKHRKLEFELAKNIHEGDSIKVTGEKKKVDVIFCDRLQKLNKGIPEGKQMRLLV